MRNAFDDPESDSENNSSAAPAVANSGLKINNSKSRFQPKVDQKKEFEQKVKDSISEKTDRNKKALELGQKFLSLLHDKTLTLNKSIIQKDFEKQICNDLFLLATAVNNDPNEHEGAGSLVLDTLFFKSLLIIRDRLNDLEFSNKQIKDSIESLTASK